MKKTLLLILVVLIVGISGSAFAATVGYAQDSLALGQTTGYTTTIKLSKNVAMQVQITDPANRATDPAINYTMGAYHTTGSRTFATSNQDQKLYYQDGTGKAIPAPGVDTVTPPTWGSTWLPL